MVFVGSGPCAGLLAGDLGRVWTCLWLYALSAFHQVLISTAPVSHAPFLHAEVIWKMLTSALKGACVFMMRQCQLAELT